MQKYRTDPYVRDRILEFLGARPGSGPTAVWLKTLDPDPDALPRRLPVSEVESALEHGAELERSLWDTHSLIAHLDIEHVDFDGPETTWASPEEAFRLQRPVVEAVQTLLLECGIVPLHLLTGRGHHFAWAIDRESDVARRLEVLGWRRRQMPSSDLDTVGPDLGSAWHGLGMVMEFLAQEVLVRAARATAVPLALTAVEVGPGSRGRQIVSLDVSEYGDPLHLRTIRVPYGPYLKRERLARARGESEETPLLAIPLHEMDEATALRLMTDPAQVALLARRASAGIPDRTEGMENLLSRYRNSPLHAFHRWHYEGRAATTSELPGLPPCVEEVLEPTERVLKPAGMQLVVRTLLAEGWPSHHIADLVAERMRDLLPDPPPFDPQTRADFYVRMFAGLIVTGGDRLLDYNCTSTQEKGYCPGCPCGMNLADLGEELRLKVEHGWPAAMRSAHR